MLYTNIKKLFDLRGIKKPVKFLKENGFSDNTAYKIVSHRFTSLSLDKVEKLCIALSCTPNDLLEFKPDPNSSIPENHPLQKLKPTESFNIFDITKDIPNEKIPEFKSALEEIKSKLLK